MLTRCHVILINFFKYCNLPTATDTLAYYWHSSESHTPSLLWTTTIHWDLVDLSRVLQLHDILYSPSLQNKYEVKVGVGVGMQINEIPKCIEFINSFSSHSIFYVLHIQILTLKIETCQLLNPQPSTFSHHFMKKKY